jgi:poly(A) polymerase
MNNKEQSIKIIKTIQSKGFEAVWAGGCVRDTILNLEPNDYDIATNATPNDIERIFDNSKFDYKFIINKHCNGNRFGVSLIKGIEVATFRTDGKYEDGRRPEGVEFCDMEHDAARRDFTCNALYMDPVENTIYDFVNGINDINNKKLKFVGKAIDRINEDYLRMLRFVRFLAKFDFDYDYDDIDTIQNNAENIKKLSGEVILMELVKMAVLFPDKFAKCIVLMKMTNLLQYIFPSVDRLDTIEQDPINHPEGVVWEHTILTVSKLQKDIKLETKFAALFHDTGKYQTKGFNKEKNKITFYGHEDFSVENTKEELLNLKASNDFIDSIISLISNHMRFRLVKEMKKSKLIKFFALDDFDELIKLHKADCLGSDNDLEYYNFCLKKINELKDENSSNVTLPKRLINGDDLISIGYTPGKIFKDILDTVFDLQLEGSINTKEDAIQFILDKYCL